MVCRVLQAEDLSVVERLGATAVVRTFFSFFRTQWPSGYLLNNLIVLKIGRPLTPGPCHLSQAPSPLAMACESRLRAPMLLPAVANTGVARGGHCPSRINHSL